MQAKTRKEALKEAKYKYIEQQRKAFAGQDCFTVVTNDGIVHAIGYEKEYPTCLDFVRDAISEHPQQFVKAGHFKDLVDAYSYLLENCDDEYELKDFLSDYFSGMEMAEYGK